MKIDVYRGHHCKGRGLDSQFFWPGIIAFDCLWVVAFACVSGTREKGAASRKIATILVRHDTIIGKGRRGFT